MFRVVGGSVKRRGFLKCNKQAVHHSILQLHEEDRDSREDCTILDQVKRLEKPSKKRKG